MRPRMPSGFYPDERLIGHMQVRVLPGVLATLAQLEEQSFRNRQVSSSSLEGGSVYMEIRTQVNGG